MIHFLASYAVEGAEQLKNPDDAIDILKTGNFFSYDVETTGLNPLVNKITMLQFKVNDEIVVVDAQEFSPELFRPIFEDKNNTFLGHNIAFDYRFTRKYGSILNRVVDTQINEKVLLCGVYNDDDHESGVFSLAGLAKKYLGLEMDKSIRKLFINFRGRFSKAMVVYGSDDVDVLVPILNAQTFQLSKYRLEKTANFENTVVPVIADIEYNGLPIQSEAWLALYNEVLPKKDRAEDELDEELLTRAGEKKAKYLSRGFTPDLFDSSLDRPRKSNINWASDEQVMDVLQNVFGLFPQDKHKKSSAGKKALEYLRTEEPIVKKILDFRKHEMACKTFGKSFLGKHVQSDDRVHTEFNQIVATGRVSCLTGDTVIHTTDGAFTLDDFDTEKHPNCCIYTHKGNLCRVYAKIDKGLDIVFEVETEEGSIVRATGNHRIWDGMEWVYVKDLYVGRRVLGAICEPASENPRNKITNEFSKESSTGSCQSYEKTPAGTGGTFEQVSKRIKRVPTKDRQRPQGRRCWFIRETYPERRNGIQDCRNYGCRPADNSKKHTAFFTADSKERSNQKTNRGRMEVHCAFEFYTRRSFRSGGKLLYKSRNVFLSSLCGVCNLGKLKHDDKRVKKTACFLCRERGYTEKSYRLETQLARDSAIRSVAVCKHHAYARVFVLRKHKTYGRFLFPRKTIVVVGGRFHTSKRETSFGSSIARRREIVNSVKEQLQHNGDFNKGNRYRYWFGCEYHYTKIKRITKCGVERVWDISVEGDHSYVAGGLIHHNSKAPNLQNIPGDKRYRACFRPTKGNIFVIADYSSQEGRVMADAAHDEDYIEFFLHGDSDPHSFVATKMFSKKFGREFIVTKDNENKAYRQKGKILNFFVSYGGSAYTLALDLNIPKEDAQELIDAFFDAFPGLSTYFQKLRYFALEKGYILVDTYTERRRWLPTWKRYRELYETKKKGKLPAEQMSELLKIKGSIERAGMNTPIQGTAGGITKLALVYLRQALLDNKYEAQIVNVIHDEIITMTKENLADEIAKLQTQCMIDAGAKFVKRVPMVADVHIDDKWSK